ncbi:MAG: hypothetical protein DDT23_00929 [candidate division WS2 bacterium]|nr:hypothetical protein [Candidatus Lithacetigena glycinireducens]
MGKNKIYICGECGLKLKNCASLKKRGLGDKRWLEICPQCVLKMISEALRPGAEDSFTFVFVKHPRSYKEPKVITSDKNPVYFP